MRKLLYLISLLFCFSMEAQELYRLELDEYQYVENIEGGIGSQLKLPKTHATVMIAGLNDLDGMNKYIDIYGGKLIVDTSNTSLYGTQEVVLRREDGKNFFGLFPKISAKLIPVIHPHIEK